MPFPLLAAAAAPSLIKGLSGLYDIFSGKSRARKNIRPVDSVDENITKNAAIAEQMAAQGIPQQEYNMAKQGIDRNRAVALTALGRSGNPSAGLNGLLRASNDAIGALDTRNASTRLANKRFAFGTRDALANERRRVWNWNSRDRFLEESAAAGQQIGSGKANAFGALTDFSVLGQQALASDNGTTQTTPSPNFYQQMNRYGTPNYGYRGAYA